MKKTKSLIICLLVALFIHTMCMGKEKPPKLGRYFAGSILGSISGIYTVAGGYRILGLETNKQGLDGFAYALTITSTGFASGSCIGTTIVARNKMKVFSINIAVTAIPLGLLYWLDHTRIMFGFYGLIVTPIFSAIHAYKIDMCDYNKRNLNAQAVNSFRWIGLMTNPFESIIQREIINERQNYTPMGQKINVVKMPLLNVSW